MPKPRSSAAVVAVALVVVACTGGGGDPPTPGEPSFAVPTAQAFDHDRQGPAEPIEGAVTGGTVTMLTSSEFEHIPFFGPDGGDPTGSYFWAPFMSGFVTRSLTQYVYDPAQDAMVVVPDIATDIGRPNADFTEWTFTIRDGVRFEDGAEVTADDVAFAIKRSLDRTSFPAGPPYSNEYFLDGDTYEGPYVSGTGYAGVVIDGDDVTVKMARPFPDMPYWAAWPAIGPIPEFGSDPATYWEHPLATGPYMFGDYSPGESLTLVRNPEWDPNTDPGRHAYPDRIVARFGVPTKQIEQTILGDSAAGRTTFTPDWIAREEPAYDTGVALGRLTTGDRACTFLWDPDYRKLTDIRVRRAIGYAYPYQAAANVIGVPQTQTPSQSLLPPYFPGRRDYRSLDVDPGETDVAKAADLVAEARKDGVPAEQFVLRWVYAKDDPVAVARAQVVSAALERAGFTASPLPVTADRADDLNFDPRAPINIRYGSWCGDWTSGSNWIPPVLRTGGGANYSYFSEPDVDEAIDAVSALPIDQQPAAWAALDEQIMTERYPVVVFGGSSIGMLHGAQIAGIHIDPPNGPNPTYKDIHIVR